MFKDLIINIFGRNKDILNCSGPYCEFARPTGTFCEPAGSGIIARPGYAISNIPYILLGIYILISDRKSKVGILFGITSILIGTCSLIYDVTYTYAAQFFDNLAMASFVVLLFSLNLKRLFKFGKATFAIIYLGLILFYASLLYFVSAGIGTIVFAFFVALVLFTELIIYKKSTDISNYKNWVIGVFLFFTGWAIWQLDGRKIWCDPSHLLNGRGIFHYATTIVIFFLWKFYKKKIQS